MSYGRARHHRAASLLDPRPGYYIETNLLPSKVSRRMVLWGLEVREYAVNPIYELYCTKFINEVQYNILDAAWIRYCVELMNKPWGCCPKYVFLSFINKQMLQLVGANPQNLLSHIKATWIWE